MLGSWVEVGDGQLHCLDLLIFGRDGADLVADLVTLHRHILPLDIGDVHKDVAASVGRCYETVAFGAGETLTHTSEHWALRSTGRR